MTRIIETTHSASPGPERRPNKVALRSLVLLCGSVYPTPFIQSVRRSPLDLPLADNWSVLDNWVTQAEGLAEQWNRDRLPVRVVLSKSAAIPTPRCRPHCVPIVFERDASDFRGTAGILHDLYADSDEEGYILVAGGTQVLSSELSELTTCLVEARADVAMLADEQGLSIGLMLMRTACLRCVPPIGYVDLKEQALPRIAQDHRVAVVRRPRIVTHTVRHADQYLAAVHNHHLTHRYLAGRLTPDAQGHRAFSIVEHGATVGLNTRVHDSVVLGGARVGPDAVIVRSVVCKGGVVKRGQHVIDRVVTRWGVSSPIQPGTVH
ncbi:MAG: hypothetical protein GC164_02250 [Phycisphaera sp.]|nr:hypothetical protein [Phycisphaera sp.]